MTELTFTDQELAYLKAELPCNESILFQSAKKAFRLEALIARLEAAERVCVGIENICKNHDLHGQAEEDIKAWRRVSGKAGPL